MIPRFTLPALLAVVALSVVAQLTDMPNGDGVSARRYLVGHRLTARPWPFLHVSAWDGALLAGPDRQIELWYWNPVQVFTQLRNERPQTKSNAYNGGDIELRLPSGWRVGASVMLDDAQIFSTPARDDEPPSFAFSASVTKPLAAINFFLGYTMVSSLAYRTHDPAEAMLIDVRSGRSTGAGLARNFSDYDRLTARVSVMAFPLVVVTPEVTLLRQGEGDLRQPFPPEEDYATTATVFQGTVERTLRAAVEVNATLRRGITLSGNAGWHHVTNVGHVAGQSDDRFVGTVNLRYVWGRSWNLR